MTDTPLARAERAEALAKVVVRSRTRNPGTGAFDAPIYQFSWESQHDVGTLLAHLAHDVRALSAVVAAAERFTKAEAFFALCLRDGGPDDLFEGEPDTARNQWKAALDTLTDAVITYRAQEGR